MRGPVAEQRGDNLQVLGQARLWLGTPYLHQASCLGAGCDCLGLVRGIWRALHLHEPEQPPGYSMDWSEPQGQELLWQAALRHLVPKPVADAALGDVLLFRMRAGAVAKHLGIQSCCVTQDGEAQSQGAAFIHAYSARGVVESALTPSWHRRVVARFTFPEELN